jgi:glycosyltransferase involved in cell wall biosynthesis
MTNNTLVSIIIPVFNAGEFLKRCLESISVQTWHWLDVVIINDGSTDESLEIIGQFIRSDTRFRVFSQNNHGASSARNLGLDKCIGEYLTFVDADDFIVSTMIEELITQTPKSISPLVFCNNFEIWKHGLEERRLFEDIKENLNIPRNLVISDIINGRAGLVCSKLFKFDIIKEHGIRFDEKARMCEDQLFFIQIALFCTDYRVVKKPLYYYNRKNEKSITLAWLPNAIDVHIYVHKKMWEIIEGSELSSIFAESMRNRLKNIAVYCFVNEVTANNSSTLFEKIRRIKIILGFPDVIKAFAVNPAKRIVDKFERLLVIRKMPMILYLLCWIRNSRLKIQHSK